MAGPTPRGGGVGRGGGRGVSNHTNDQPGLLMQAGPVYFHPCRYENERGDFANWALSTMALLQGVYNNLWFDACHYLIGRVDEYTRRVAAEVQLDMSLQRLVTRWTYLRRVHLQGQADWPDSTRARIFAGRPAPYHRTQHTFDRQADRNLGAVKFLSCPEYQELNRRMDAYVDTASLGGMYITHDNGHSGYLLELLGDSFRYFAAQRTHTTLMRELQDRMLLLNYVVDFANTIAPLTDVGTETNRSRCLRLYLGSCTSVLMFAPGWCRPYTWVLSATGSSAGAMIPQVNLQHNHRFRAYLDFLNRRATYYAACN